jgi:hypothetical protein
LECECPKGLVWNNEEEKCECPDPVRMILDVDTLTCSCPPEFEMITFADGLSKCACRNNMVEATRT